MDRRTLLLRAVLLGTGGGGARAGAAAATAPAAAQVSIDNFTFSPAVLTVAPGTTVTWTNHDDIPHTVMSKDDPARKRSPVLDTDDSYSLVFDTPGAYGFFCSLHPHMQSQIIVR